jgi:hypothetical protein
LSEREIANLGRVVPRRFRAEVSKAGEIAMQGGVPTDIKAGNKFRAALAATTNRTTFQEEYAKLISTYHSLIPVSSLEKMTIEELDSITDWSLEMARLRKEADKEPEPEQKRDDLFDSMSEEDRQKAIQNIIDREMSHFYVPGKSPNGPFGQQLKDDLLDLFEVKDAAEQDEDEDEKTGTAIQERAMRPSARDDDESAAEADEAERLENKWIQGMQRWLVQYDTKTSPSVPYGAVNDMHRLCLPFRQVYIIYMDFAHEMTDEMIMTAFLYGAALCRDKYQWRAADGKERSLEGQARALQLAKMSVMRQAARDRFRVFVIQVVSSRFKNTAKCLCDYRENINQAADCLVFPCMDCGKETATVCTRCDYPYCKETCLRAHIEKSKSCKCRQQHKDCNPCRANATFKKLYGPKTDAPRVYACYGCRGSLAEGKATSCPGCWVARYCSRKCQVEHWNKGGHRQRCSLWRKWKLKYGAINKKLAKFHHQGKRE